MTNASIATASIPSNFKRRKFLLAAGLGVGSVAAVTIGANDVLSGSPAQEPCDQTSRDRGYQATEHVRNYYRTARI